MKALVWISGAFSLGLYAGLIWVLLNNVMPGANGQLPPDLQILGYTPETLARFMAALTPEARDALTGPVRLLDTAFPLVFGVFLCALSWRLSTRQHAWSRMVLLIPPVGFAVMDLCENVLIQELVAAPGPMDVSTAVLASEFTVTKFLLLFASLVALVATWARGRRPSPEEATE